MYGQGIQMEWNKFHVKNCHRRAPLGPHVYNMHESEHLAVHLNIRETKLTPICLTSDMRRSLYHWVMLTFPWIIAI